MNKKILTVSIVIVLMLLAISFSTAVSSNTAKTIKKKESPLFGIRTRQAIREKIGDIIENIKTKYIGERVFILPFQLLRIKLQYESFISETATPCSHDGNKYCSSDNDC